MKLSSKQALDKAREAQSAGHNETAEKIYRAILKTQPKNAEANYQLGVLLESHGDYNSALVPFKTALEITPSNSKFLVSYLENLISAKKFSSATEFIENVSKRGFNLELIESYRRKLVDATADSSIQKSSSSPSHLAKTKINSSDSVPPEEEVETLIVSYNRGEFDKARNLASALTTNYPNHPTGWNILGAALGQLGRYEEAAAVGERLTSLLPRDHSAFTNLGTTYASLGKLEEALTCHQRALNLKPDFAEAHCNLGFALKDLKRHDEALKSFNESLKFQPKLAQANVGLGLVFECS